MDVTIRDYVPSDREACRELWRELTQHHRDLYDDPGIGGEDPGLQFDAYLADPKLASAWVAEHRGEVVGLAGLRLHGEEGEIEPVVVLAAHRTRGVGRCLVERVTESARERGLRNLSVRPVARNAEAIACFHALGFRLLGHVEMFRPLQPRQDGWRAGITIHGHELRY